MFPSIRLVLRSNVAAIQLEVCIISVYWIYRYCDACRKRYTIICIAISIDSIHTSYKEKCDWTAILSWGTSFRTASQQSAAHWRISRFAASQTSPPCLQSKSSEFRRCVGRAQPRGYQQGACQRERESMCVSACVSAGNCAFACYVSCSPSFFEAQTLEFNHFIYHTWAGRRGATP